MNILITLTLLCIWAVFALEIENIPFIDYYPHEWNTLLAQIIQSNL